MASITTRPQLIPFSNKDPRLPQSMWIGFATLVGDLGGGVNDLNILWNQVGSPLLFSVEEISADQSGSGNIIIQVRTRMDAAEGNDFRLSVNKAFVAGSTGGQFALDVIIQPKIIFSPRDVTNAWGIYAEVNNTNGISTNVLAWGYVWQNLAQLMEGGPIRPGSFLPEIS